MAEITNLRQESIALQGAVRTNLDYSSGIRRGKVDRLPLGELPHYDVDGPCIVSNRDGNIVYHPGGKVEVGTFLMSKKYSFKYIDLSVRKGAMFDKLSKDFVKFETKTVCDSLSRQDNIVYEDREKVKLLQDFFYDLGRNVIVLPNEEVVDINSKSFQLVIRNDLCIETFDEPAKMVTQFVAWEEVGFIYRLEKNYDSYIRSDPSD